MLTALLGVSSTAMASHGVDSIGVENVKGKKVILYKVEPKQRSWLSSHMLIICTFFMKIVSICLCIDILNLNNIRTY